MQEAPRYVFEVGNLPSTGVCTVPIKSIDPYDYPVILFTKNGTQLGALNYWVVYNTNGVVNVEYLEPPQLKSSCVPPQVQRQRDKPTMFLSSALFFTQLPEELANVHTSITTIRTRIEWIEDNCITNNRSLAEPPYNAVAVLGCATIAMYIRKLTPVSSNTHIDYNNDEPLQVKLFSQFDRLASIFEKERLRLETQVFNRLLAPFLQQGNEKLFIQFLVNHGMSADMLKRYIIDGTPQDSRTTITRHLYKPMVYVRVKAVEVPQSVLSVLPLYPGGYVHLHPADVGVWLLSHSARVCRRWNDGIWTCKVDNLPVQLLDTARELYTRLAKYATVNKDHANVQTFKKDVIKRSAQKRAASDIAPIQGVGVRHLPACMQFAGRPLDQQRTRLAWSMQAAGCSVEECIEVINEFHKMDDPSATIEDTKRAWDPTSGYEKGNHNLAPWCQTMVKNRTVHGSVARCPYGDSVYECKKSCIANLRSRHRVLKTATPYNLNAPWMFIQWSHDAERHAKEEAPRRGRKHIKIEIEEEEENSSCEKL